MFEIFRRGIESHRKAFDDSKFLLSFAKGDKEKLGIFIR